jgi:hypothetical protein
MTGYCVKGKHKDCPDTKNDTYTCNCPCHISSGIANEPVSMSSTSMVEHLKEQEEAEAKAETFHNDKD